MLTITRLAARDGSGWIEVDHEALLMRIIYSSDSSRQQFPCLHPNEYIADVIACGWRVEPDPDLVVTEGL